MIYADNAATTKLSEAALSAMLPYLREEYGNPSGLYAFAQRQKEVLERCRGEIAKILNCEAREIYLTSGGSEADNQALLSLAAAGEKKGKKHIVSTAFEHHAVLHTLRKLQARGFEVTLLPVHEDGIVRPEEAEAAIRPDTAFVTVMYANNEIGTIQPISAIGEICARRGVPFHTDAVQAAGHLNIDVRAENIDALSLSAHKFHGPKGVGALYFKKTLPLASLIEGGAQERNRRAGTENVAGIVGMTAALQEEMKNLEKNREYVCGLRDKLIAGLKKIPHSRLNGDEKRRLAGNVNLCFEGIEGESLLLFLDDMGIAASSGSACTSGSLDPSHVLLAIGVPHEVAHGSLRLTLCEYNTVEEVEYMVQKVPEVVAKLRAMSPVWRDLQEGKRQYVIQ
ncbi:MAG: aminotransferase class V-fold PLP-dependent enzyme [Clostridia bacterium]|nr:aminotransferase class V-fold PLP-dependent enzyme [Clostridia bacterium]